MGRVLGLGRTGYVGEDLVFFCNILLMVQNSGKRHQLIW